MFAMLESSERGSEIVSLEIGGFTAGRVYTGFAGARMIISTRSVAQPEATLFRFTSEACEIVSSVLWSEVPRYLAKTPLPADF